MPQTTDHAVINSIVLLIKALCGQMKTTIEAIREFDQEIEALCRSHQEYYLFASLPGAGEDYASRLTAAMGTDKGRWTTADELLCFSGIASVTE